MAFCTECGFKLPDNAAFCPNCGNRLSAAINNTEPETAVPSPVGGGADIDYSADVEAAPEAERKEQDTASVTGEPEGAGQEAQNPPGDAAAGGYSRQPPGNGAYGAGSGSDAYSNRGNGAYSYDTGAGRYNTGTDYGYHSGGPGSPPVQKSGNSKTALIVIASVVVLLVVATILIINAVNEAAQNPRVPEISAPVPTAGIGAVAESGYVEDGNYYISFVGAEEFIDINNKPAIRIYYEFTNYYRYPQSALYTLDWDITQDGKDLTSEYSYSLDDVDVYYYDGLNIRTALTIQCCLQYNYDPAGGAVDVVMYGYSSGKEGGAVSGSFVPGGLPGAPAPYAFVEYRNPQWTLTLQSEGYLDGEASYVAVTDAELIEDAYGDPAIRVYYEYTNHGAEPSSMKDAFYIYSYQDGVSLFWTYATEDSETDKNYDKEIAPGETITASIVFSLRNQTSSVEAEVEASSTYDAIGHTFIIT